MNSLQMKKIIKTRWIYKDLIVRPPTPQEVALQTLYQLSFSVCQTSPIRSFLCKQEINLSCDITSAVRNAAGEQTP